MGKYNGAIVTTVGQSLIANAVASNQKIIFTKMKASTHVYASTTDFESMTSIADIVQSVDISYVGVYNNNIIQASAQFTNTGVATAFAINTIGLYGKVGNGAETLVAVVTAVNADTMPVADPVSPTSIIYNIQMTVQNSGVMDVEVNPAGTINVHQFNDALYSTVAVAVPTTGWTASGSQYTKTIDVGGVTGSSMPFVELQYPDNVTATQKKAIDKAASKLVSLTTTNYGQVVLTATAIPETSFNLFLRGLGSGQYTQPYNEFFTTVLDEEPYVSRSARDGLVKFNLVGGTVAWNQLVQNGDFADGTNYWSGASSTISVSNGICQVSIAQTWNNDCRQSLKTLVNHKYLVTFEYKGDEAISGAVRLVFGQMGPSGATMAPATSFVTTSFVKYHRMFAAQVDAPMVRLSLNGSGNQYIGSSYYVRNVNLIDLTQMFGTTIADYIYSLEQATEGSGIAWLQSYGFFTKDYYAYDAGSLQSVCTSGRKITALDGTIRNYSIENVELRGLFKLDSNNRLVANGDTYPSSGSGTRKYGIATVDGSEDENWTMASNNRMYMPLTMAVAGKGISDRFPYDDSIYSADKSAFYIGSTTPNLYFRVSGITTVADWRTYLANNPIQVVYELATETTFSADPYINPQRSEGTEEFVDGLTRDVMVPVGNKSTYFMSEVIPIMSEYIDAVTSS